MPRSDLVVLKAICEGVHRKEIIPVKVKYLLISLEEIQGLMDATTLPGVAQQSDHIDFVPGADQNQHNRALI